MKNLKTYTEKNNTLTKESRRNLLDSLASSEYGQAIREELVELINETSNVLTISPTMIDGESKRLAVEIVGMGKAVEQLEKMYKLLIPRKREKVGFKTKR